MRHLNDEEVTCAIISIENGTSIQQLVRNFNIIPSVIHFVWNRYIETGGYKRFIRQNRKRKTNQIQDWFFVLPSLNSHKSTAKGPQIELRAIHYA